MAAQAGVDIARLKGSGPHGRIVKADIDAALKGGAAPRAPSAPAAAPKAPPMAATPSMAQVAALAGNAPYTPIPHTSMRRTIARRLTEVQQSVPVFYLTVDCEIDALLKARADVNAQSESKISVNDFVIKAAALRAVAARAKANKLKLEEFQGGPFSISNWGMFGVSEFTAVINPPQSCILAVAAGIQQPVVRNGTVGVATVMRCTISCDHRVVDGATSAQFMNAFKKYIESPVTMLL